MFGFKKAEMVSPDRALPGRDQKMQLSYKHYISQLSMAEPYPEGFEYALFGLGCFWGAERKFWQLEGVYVTAVGYAAGYTPNPTYEEVCTGLTGHNEVVLVVYDPSRLSFKTLLKTFWEAHNPTEGMRQGNDVGTQYRSGIYVYSDEQKALAEKSLALYEAKLKDIGFPVITTEIKSDETFYFAEEYHQQYLAKNPAGYCGLGGTGITCPVE